MASLSNNPYKRFKASHKKMTKKLTGHEVHDMMKKKPSHWIQGAIKHPGALHRQLGVKQGHKIPAAKLRHAASQGGVLGRRARLAETLKGLHHKKSRKSGSTLSMMRGDVEKKGSKKRKSTVGMGDNVETKRKNSSHSHGHGHKSVHVHMKKKGTVGMGGDVEMKKSRKHYKHSSAAIKGMKEFVSEESKEKSTHHKCKGAMCKHAEHQKRSKKG